MKIKLVVLIAGIISCCTSFASQDEYSSRQKALFDQKYHSIETQLTSLNPNFVEIAALYLELQELAAQPNIGTRAFDYLGSLLQVDAMRYILSHVEKSLAQYEDVQIEVLEFAFDQDVADAFFRAGVPLKKAIDAAFAMNALYPLWGGIVTFKKHNDRAIYKVAKIAAFFDMFINKLSEIAHMNKGLDLFLNQVIEIWEQLSNQLVSAHMIDSIRSYKTLKKTIDSRVSLSNSDSSNHSLLKAYKDQERLTQENIEIAHNYFEKIAKNKLSENVSWQKVMINVQERFKLFDHGIEHLIAAIKGLVFVGTVNCSSNNKEVRQQEYEQKVTLLNELFDYFELYIQQFKDLADSYSTPGEDKIRVLFDGGLQYMESRIDDILEPLLNEKNYTKLLTQIVERCDQIEEKLSQPQFGDEDIRILKIDHMNAYGENR